MLQETHSNQSLDQATQRSTLYIAASEDGVHSALEAEIKRAGFQCTESHPGVITVPITPSEFHSLGVCLQEGLGNNPLEPTRCLLAPESEEPSLARLMHSPTLAELIDYHNAQWVRDLIQRQRLLTHFQPIVYCDDPEQVFAYECLLRGRDENDRPIPPGRLFGAARAAGLMRELDQAACLTAIQSASERKLTACVFINFNPCSIDEESLERTLWAALGSSIPAERFVFEVVESDKVVDPERLMTILDSWREAGCRVALDDMGAGYNSLNLMAEIKPDFIKLDMGLIRNVHQDTYKSCVAGKLLELAKELEVGTVVEGVETVDEWQWSAEHGADFAQGYFFARPSAEPPQPPFCLATNEVAK